MSAVAISLTVAEWRAIIAKLRHAAFINPHGGEKREMTEMADSLERALPSSVSEPKP